MRPEPKLSRGTSMTSTARRGIALLAASLDRTSHTNRDIWFTSKWDELLFSSSSLASVAVSVRSRLTQTIDYCSTCVVDVVDVTCCLHVRARVCRRYSMLLFTYLNSFFYLRDRSSNKQALFTPVLSWHEVSSLSFIFSRRRFSDSPLSVWFYNRVLQRYRFRFTLKAKGNLSGELPNEVRSRAGLLKEVKPCWR